MGTIASIIGWIFFGLIAGALARLIHPGRDPMSWPMTIVLGICGSLLGGGIAYVLGFGGDVYQPGRWIMSILGAILLLALGIFGTPRKVSKT